MQVHDEDKCCLGFYNALHTPYQNINRTYTSHPQDKISIDSNNTWISKSHRLYELQIVSLNQEHVASSVHPFQYYMRNYRIQGYHYTYMFIRIRQNGLLFNTNYLNTSLL